MEITKQPNSHGKNRFFSGSQRNLFSVIGSPHRIKRLTAGTVALCCCFSAAQATAERESRQVRPNILFILVDDMGYSDLGCYGGEIETPNIDSLAENGLRFTQMYNTAKCMTSRACLLTGVYAQQCGMDRQPVAMINSVTLGEVLRPAGYRTLASGKHHGTENLFDRGFDHYYGLRDGCSNLWNPGVKRAGEAEPGRKRTRTWCDDAKTVSPYTPEDRKFYATDAFTDKPLTWLDEKALDDKPFFLYLAYTAPHYPLHAWPEDIAKYEGRYDAGFAAIQQARYQRMVDIGLIDPAKTPFEPMAESAWKKLKGEALAKEIKRMEIYAAMLDRVDQNIGRILAKLKEQGKLNNTLIMFASDNGACAEASGAKIKSTKLEDFGSVASYETVGKNWATVQNTPLRNWKNYSHEGGIRTPFIVNWPDRIKDGGGFYHEPAHLIDIMPTLVDLTGAIYPKTFEGKTITPMQGVSLLPAFESKPLMRDKPIFFQWKKGGAVRDGDWKAVFWGNKWELFDMSADHNESNDLSSQYPEKMGTMKELYQNWYQASRKGVSNE
jgi:arylsulfatase